MQTVITETSVKPGQEAEWDRVFQERVADARKQLGWLGVELLIPSDQPAKRVVVGTWQSRTDWDRWHDTQAFKETRQRLAGVTESDGEPRWYAVEVHHATQA